MSKQTILVIDDSSDMLALQKTILEGDGFDVLTAQSGASAFEVLSKIADLDLILLDLQMEDMSGTDFLKILEERWPEIVGRVPVVFLSGGEPPPESKAVGFIHKFPDIDVFLAAVHRFVESGTSLLH